MDQANPTPPDPESLNRGYEVTDVALKPIIIFLVVLVLFGGALQAVMTFIMKGYATADAKIEPPKMSDLQDHNKLNKPPALQQNTTEDMLKMYVEEDAVLNEYHVDSKTKAIRVPINRAIQIVAKKGLPTRANPPKMDMSKELPYPARSQPYKAAP